MEGVAFFDLEAEKSTGKINSIGACLEERTWHGRSLHDFEKFCEPATYYCGHNIFAHDLPHLVKKGVSETFLQSRFIDTLYLSALFFASKPYHHLIKDYQLASNHLNNPVEDARLAKNLLYDCVAAYHAWPRERQQLFDGLLGHTQEFKGFFQLVCSGAERTLEPDVLTKAVFTQYQDRICRHAPLQELLTHQPIPFAYALALLDASDKSSVIPPWLLYRYPVITEMLHQLRASDCRQEHCSYCNQHLSPVVGLRRYFGYEGFRKFSDNEDIPLQQQVVEAALKGESLVAIFPTGGGKSLAFQLPALMKGEAGRGLTVVISPLQALMKDQVDVLRTRFDIIQAIAINGLLSPLERAEAIRIVREGGASLLYIAPESLRSNTIVKLLRERHIERFVIDEAHCFSAWGQDFRVDYLYIGRFLKDLAQAKGLTAPIPVSCFTATAKPEVIQDIQYYFRQQAQIDLKLYQTAAARKNLSYHASRAEHDDAKRRQLCDLLQQVTEPAIVYVSRTKTAERVAGFLQKAGFQAEAYHGQMEADTKTSTQDRFLRGETAVIVATSAFGMGVDKENVKMVVHYDIADSLENYMQEAGRAGRKADMEARCHLLFDEHDLNDHFALLNRTRLSKKEIGQIWKAVKEFKKTSFTKSALEIARQAGWDTDIRDLETQVKTAIAALEEANFIRREQNAPRIFAKSILVRSVEEANQVIRAHPDLFPGKLEEEAIRIFQHLISRTETQADYIADTLGIEKDRVVQVLLLFKQLGLLGDTQDLTAVINPARSKKNSLRCFQQKAQVELALLALLLPSEEAAREKKMPLRDMNERLCQAGCTSSEEVIRSILQFWERQHYIRKERIDAVSSLYRITFKETHTSLRDKILFRQELAGYVIRWLIAQNTLRLTQANQIEEAALEFSMMEMKQAVESAHILTKPASLVDYEAALIYLNFMEAIKLEGGLFVLYNPMTIVRVEKNPLKQYTQKDYAVLERHYEKKTEQIHIIGEYARKQLTNHVEALNFVNDYFTLSYEHFIQKYFRGEKGRLKRPVTQEKFAQIFGSLSEEQLQVVKDNKSTNILVGAGPGSGKTRVLVHKVAALLLMEDIKPEQFLMLTFSRPAAQDFRERLYELIGSTAYHIDIFTYHGYAFRLWGRVGDLKRSENIITETTHALKEGELTSERIKAKSVIVVDEYQDISQQEYDFLQVIATLADEVRIMVVGDDDQNIYEFRGSSVAFMQNFEQQRQAARYMLTRNYRACANLVDFSNQFLSLFSAERLKAGQLLRAMRPDQGNLQIHQYNPASDLVIPLVNDLVSCQLQGTTAVLTATNEQALLVMSLLTEKKVSARLISSQQGFSLRQLLELKSFSHFLYQALSETNHDLGYISEEVWIKGRERINREFAASANLPLALEVIDAFWQMSYQRKFWSDWFAYLQEIRTEDFIYPEKNSVLVSTMHKAKGKEFDHVFLLLPAYRLSGEANKRVIYVAITRARHSLHIHTDHTCFQDFSVPGLQYHQEARIYAAADSFQIELGMKDIWLGFFKQTSVRRAVKMLQAGVVLVPAPKMATGLTTGEGSPVVRYSRLFQEKLSAFLAQGYVCCKAEVASIVVWYCEENAQTYRVVLPRLNLTKCSK